MQKGPDWLTFGLTRVALRTAVNISHDAHPKNDQPQFIKVDDVFAVAYGAIALCVVAPIETLACLWFELPIDGINAARYLKNRPQKTK